MTDVYMYNYYRNCFNRCAYLNPENFQSELDAGLDVFIYVTSWVGISNREWQGLKYRKKPAEALDEILTHCRQKGIATIFQSIEDPSNYDYFLEIARKFEFVFTSDTDCIERYRRDLGHDRVYYGEYGVNPQLCNPIGSGRAPLNAAFFAGSYPTRYPERCRDMETIFDSIIGSGCQLVIADRNLFNEEATLRFPDRFDEAIVAPFEHAQLQNVHKLFRQNLNFNSIKASPTMCAMRVYELQAMGRGIISNYARSVFNKFPNIKIVPERQDLSSFFVSDDLETVRGQMDAVRDIMISKTNFEMATEMMALAGLVERQPTPKIAVILAEQSGAAHNALLRQTYEGTVPVPMGVARTPDAWADFARENEIEYFTFFSDDVNYADDYLQRLINAFKFTNCDYITHNASVIKGNIQGAYHEFTHLMGGKNITLFSTESYAPTDLSHLSMNELARYENGYATDPFGIASIEPSIELEPPSSDFALSVIIPVFNNGRFLRAKCIDSIRRSAIWSSLDIVLVDDGSTDEVTLAECRRIAETYSNIQFYAFPEGGSGSASRPRNKGMALARAPLISFLDPDNEISLGGFEEMLSIFNRCRENGTPVDFVSGYQVKVGEQNKFTGRHTRNEVEVVDNLQERFFQAGRFPVISTQAAVIDRAVIERSNLQFVEGAAGQDTLFGWELLAGSTRAAFTGKAFICYYFERASSVTNTLDPDYFRKKLTLEKAQQAWLKRQGLLQLYVDHHLDKFIRSWYLAKLAEVPTPQSAEASALLREIIVMYGANPANYGFDSKCEAAR